MQPTLADFRIESDNVVWLALGDGRTYRVSPADLGKVLSGDDIKRVRAALRERTRFMKRILPPTALFVLALSVAGLGNLDFRQLTHSSGVHQPPIAANYCVPGTPALPPSLMPSRLFSAAQPEPPSTTMRPRGTLTTQATPSLSNPEITPASAAPFAGASVAQQPITYSAGQSGTDAGFGLLSSSKTLPIVKDPLPSTQGLLAPIHRVEQELPLNKPLLGL